VSDLILHHYDNSPFAHKVRMVMGYKGLAWKSVIVPNIMPKPDVVALTGGYRKTPFLQVGSDIYCDTSLILDVIEHLHPSPSLYPGHKGLARTVAQWADEKLFWAAMAFNFQPQGVANILGRGRPPEQWMAEAQAFNEDRAKMRGGAPRMRLGDATSALKSYLRRLSNMLEGHDFLLGGAPSIADFAACHPLWFTQQIAKLPQVFEATPAVGQWMARMASFGQGQRSELDAAQALAIASRAASSDSVFVQEAFQDDHGIALGTEVTVAADGFGPEPSAGTLISATRTHYTIRREDPRAGMVQVHFPRLGFVLKKAEA
jgi:glutathione S-transferase